MTTYRIPMNLQFFADNEPPVGGDDTPQTVKIGDKEFTVDELQTKLDGYSKLEKQFTKVSQENSELKKTSEQAKAWLDFEAQLTSMSPEVQQKFVNQTNEFFAAVQSGNVTQQDISGINKAIKSAEKAGDDKTAEKLTEARDSALELNELYEEFEEKAEEDGFAFKKREFRKYLEKWVDEEGYDEDESLNERDLRRAFKDFRASKKKEAEKQNLPSVGTGSSGVGVGNTKPNDKGPKNLAEVKKILRERLGG